MRIRFGLLAGLLAVVSCSGSGGSTSPGVPSAASAVCGDGVVQPPEQCDDANSRSDDGCLATCFRPSVFVAGDPHMHSYGCNAQKTPEELADLAEDAGLRVAAALVWGIGYGTDRPYFDGGDYPDGRPELLLHYDLEVSEFPAAKGGHLILLGLDSIDFSPHPFDSPHSGIPVAEWARRQAAVVGMAHTHLWPEGDAFPQLPGGCCMPFEVAFHAARGRLDFLAVERPGGFPLNPGAFRLWRALQNSGFRVAAAGSSDYSCLNQVFSEHTPRTDVVLDGDVSYSRWIDGLRRGAASLAVGRDSHLALRVNGVAMGGELSVRAGETLAVSVESDLDEAADVDVLVNGASAGRLRAEAGRQAATVRMGATRSAWIVARTPRVMTNPVYVLVDGRPIRASAEDTCYLIRDVANVRRLDLDRRESAALASAAYDEADAVLRQRFAEAGGQACN